MVSETIVYAFKLHMCSLVDRLVNLSDQNIAVYATSVLLGTISKFAIDEIYLILS